MSELISTKELSGLRVVDGSKDRRIGKVRRFVFHPSERRCIGLLVKRPDAALMFHRKDLFVALNGFDVIDGQLVVSNAPNATDRGAIRALGVNWDECVIWVGMPVVTESGEELGYVDAVTFNRTTGVVDHLTTENGIADKAILGKRKIPARLVRGFKSNPGDVENPGVILVSNEVLDLPAEGGVAAAAGKASVVVADKAKAGVEVAKAGVEVAKPVAHKAAKATAQQLSRASGMFSAFKEEFNKAAHGDE